MFVCVCNGVTDRQIREAVSDGACSLDELAARLGVAAGCGTCVDFARQVLHETLRSPTSSELLNVA
jgi:bacterioferritin-associated ferredoxin